MKHKLSKLLVDTRGQEPSLTSMENFNFGAEMAVMMKQFKIAVLYNEGDESIIYSMKSAVTRGLNVLGFHDENEAMKWLA